MFKLRFIPFLVMLLLLLPVLNSCGVIEQTAQMQRLSLCEFDVNGVTDIKLANISLTQGMARNDLSAAQVLQLTKALFSNELPLKLNLLVNVSNPNDKTAAMSRMDYIVFIDGLELISGQLNQSYEIGPGSQRVITLPVEMDLYKALSGQNIDVISNIGFKLTGSYDEPVNLLFKVKPYINVGNSQLAYPGFISVRHSL